MRTKLVASFIGVLVGYVVLVGAASALTLPDVSVSLGGSYPLHLAGMSSAASVAFSTSSGVEIEGKGISVLLLLKELSALGSFSTVLTNYKVPGGVSCHTGSEPEGTIAWTGEFHVVPLNLAGGLGVLFLVSEFKFSCGPANFTVRGDMIGGLTKAGEAAQELTELGTTIEGSDGKQDSTDYYNDGGTLVTAQFELDAGAGFERTALNVSGEIDLSVLGSEMLQITGRL